MAHASSSTYGWRPREGDVLCNRYEVVTKLGSGGEGSVYRVKDRSGRHYAAKLAKGDSDGKYKHDAEVEVLASLERHGRTPSGFPNLHYVGSHRNIDVLCISLLGENLRKISQRGGFNTHTALKYARQMLDRLETLHKHGFLHRDVKPHNFVIDRENTVHIIDFGLAKRFRELRTGRHLPKRRERGFAGTLKYASINTQRFVTASRRDDLESLGYSLIEMITGRLPWDDVGNREDMVRAKENTSLKKLCKRTPSSIYEYMKDVTRLSYSESPDYSDLRSLLKRR